MSLKQNNFFRSFAFRLTAWYSFLFTVALAVIFTLSYKALVSSLRHAVDHGMVGDINEIESDFLNEKPDEAKASIREEIEGEGKNRVFFRILDAKGKIFLVSDLTNWGYISPAKLNEWAELSKENDILFRSVWEPGKKFKVRVITKSIDNGKYIVQAGRIMKEDQQIINHYSHIFGWSMLLLLGFGILLGWLGSLRAMSGVKRITRTALDISRDGVYRQVQLRNEGEEIEDLAKGFNSMLNRIEQLMTELKDVTTNVAHDLRTPITRIRGLAEGMFDSDPETIGMIVDECNRLESVINTMLDIAEIESGLKNFDEVPIDIVKLVRRGYEIFLPVAQEKNINFVFQGPPEPLFVTGDTAHLQRVVSNLLDNAIKFTERDGKISVMVEASGGHVIISVEDTGIGIEEIHQPHIFEKFYRSESSRSTPGNGLGLCFAKSMVTSMGGDIAVKSAVGQGSRFTIKLKASRR